MNTPRHIALHTLAVLLVLLLVGTQMPGEWRDAVFRATQWPWQLTKVAHFVLFAALAAVALAPPLAQAWLRVGALALALALLTEGLQHFALHRDPSWVDVGIDMAGATVGVLLVQLVRRLQLLRW